MLRILAVFLAAHGIAHLPGFLVLWKLKDFPQMPYHTTLLSGRLEVGDGGARVMGVLFLLAALAFLWAGTLVWIKASPWRACTLGVSLFSLIPCLLAWPEARVGAFVDLVLLALLWRLP